MENVTVKKSELVSEVQKNRDAHRAIFEEAVEGYKKTIVGLLEQHIEQVKKGKVMRVMVNIPEPVDQTSSYDRVLKMLAMSVDDEIELSETEFASYVMDDWTWKNQFLTTNAAYSVTAARLSGA